MSGALALDVPQPSDLAGADTVLSIALQRRADEGAIDPEAATARFNSGI
jgi:hypothetical protein